MKEVELEAAKGHAMRDSTIVILIIGAIPIVWTLGTMSWQMITYPYRLDDISIPWEVLFVRVGAAIIAVGLLKWWLIDRRSA